MKNDLPFFKHHNDARNKAGARALRAQYGWDGYGKYQALLEMISEAPEARLDLSSQLNRSAAALEIGMKPDEFRPFLAFLADAERCGLLIDRDGIITAQGLVEDYFYMESRRKHDRERKPKNPPIPHFQVEKNDIPAEPDRKPKQSTAENRQSESESESENENSLKIAEQANSTSAEEQPVEKLVDNFRERIRRGLEKSPWPLLLTPQQLEELENRLLFYQDDESFIAYAIDRVRRKNPENPGGLLYDGLFRYPEWIAEHRQKRLVKNRPKDPLILPSCSCGGVIKIGLDPEVGKCLGCGTIIAYSEETKSWVKDRKTEREELCANR